jgi:excinuclease ABC subunit C
VYAGPFLPASLARKTMSLSHRLFGIRSCNEVITGRRGRPCLEYDIKRCIAPCVEALCTRAAYARAVEHARLFLEGRNDELITELKRQMHEAAAAERYEQAAELRDAIRTIETLRHRQQKMATARLGDRDAFGVKAGSEGAIIQVFQMRGGRVIERIELVAEGRPGPGPAGALNAPGAWAWPAGEGEANLLQAALQQFYEIQDAPPEIHIPVAVEDLESIEKWLTDKAGRRVRIVVPKRGDKRGLLELAARNAAVAYASRFSQDVQTQNTAIEALRGVLGLAAAPRRIECFDVSTIQGSETVGSMVVCEDGRMKRSEYRKFRVRGLGPGGAAIPSPQLPAPGPRPDDFAAMHEIVLRRYRRLLEQGGAFPDLVIVDGGKGQLSAAYGAFGELGLANLVAIGIAKQEELIFTRDASEPIALPANSPALLLIERIRDEAHRVAVSFHRQARAMRDLRSELDNIPGVGPRRRQLLLRTFGSVANLRRATREELQPVAGRRVADAVLQYFAQTPGR